MPTIFVSHSSEGKALAVEFKGILTRGAADLRVFLSSDWDSIPLARSPRARLTLAELIIP
jgi:hypothetical protein